jgi:hypothetical protein
VGNNKVILRVEKINNKQTIAAGLRHNFRDDEEKMMVARDPETHEKQFDESGNPIMKPGFKYAEHADKNLAHLNRFQILGKEVGHENWEESVNKARGIINDRLASPDLQVYKNSTIMLDYVVSASPDWDREDKRWDQYFDRAIEYVKKKHGPENVIAVAIHKDESTPHAHIWAMPVHEATRKLSKKEKENLEREGKRYERKTFKTLGAKPFTDGPKKLSDLQTDFHEKVGKRFGLDRGERRWTPEQGFAALITHTEIKDFYNRVDDLENEIERKIQERMRPKLEELERERLAVSEKSNHFDTMVEAQKEYEARRKSELDSYEAQLKNWETGLAKLVAQKAGEQIKEKVAAAVQPFLDQIKAVGSAETDDDFNREWTKLMALAQGRERRDLGKGRGD